MARYGAVAAVGATLLAAPIVLPPSPRLVWNASASAPVGLYIVDPGAPIGLGDVVIAVPPAAVRRLAVTRGYLGLGVPLVKQVAARPGDTICASGPIVRLGDALVVRRLAIDARGRPMPWWNGCHNLRAGQYFLLMPAIAGSFDSRYFGPVSKDAIIGRAHLLWAR